MKISWVKNIFIALLCFVSEVLVAQSVAINPNGYSPNTGAILDLSNQNSTHSYSTSATYGFLPPWVTLTSLATFAPLSGTSTNLTGLIVYNSGGSLTNGLYYWNGTNTPTGWVYMGLTGTGSSNYIGLWTGATAMGYGYTQDNGSGVVVSSSASTQANMLDVYGGAVIGANGSGYAGSTTAPSNGLVVQNAVSIGTASPSADAILTVSSTTQGVTLPNLTTQQATTLAATNPPSGLVIFNSSTNCFEFYANGGWQILACPCTGAPTSVYISGAASACASSTSTYTVSSVGGTSYSWTSSNTNFPISGSSTAATVSVTIPASGTTTLTVTATNSCGSTNATYTVGIGTTPTISGTTPIVNGTTNNTFTCSLSGATSYAWSITTGGTYASINSPSTNQTCTVTANSAGSFTLQCVVNVYSGCSYTVTYAASVTNCSGNITVDPNASSSAQSGFGNSTLTITTTNSDDLILVAVSGYDNDNSVNTGTVTYAGTASGTATYYGDATGGKYAPTEIYYFPANSPGTYSITVTEPTHYYSGYYQNEAVALTGFCSAAGSADLISSQTVSYTSCADVTTITAPALTTITAGGHYIFCALTNYWYSTGSGPETYTGTVGSFTTLQESNAAGGGAVSSIGGSAQSSPTASYVVVGNDAGGFCEGSMVVIDIH